MTQFQPVTLTPVRMNHGSWREDLLRVTGFHHGDRFLIVFPDIIQFYDTESTGGLYGLRRMGPLGELGDQRITAIPMPTRRLVPDDAGAVTDGYRTEEDFNRSDVRRAIESTLELIARLLRNHPDIYEAVYYFATPEVNETNLPPFEDNTFVGNYVSRSLNEIVMEENRVRGW